MEGIVIPWLETLRKKHKSVLRGNRFDIVQTNIAIASDKRE